jgi:hypothetical protein
MTTKTSGETEVLDLERTVQRERNQAVRELLKKWLADDSGYDERVWPMVKSLIEENRLSDRMRFSD